MDISKARGEGVESFSPGDHVEMTEETKRCNSHARSTTGVVLAVIDSTRMRLRRDGLKGVESWHPSAWQKTNQQHTIDSIKNAAYQQEQLRQLKQLLLDADAVARARGDEFGLCDSIDNSGGAYPSQWSADLLQAIRDEGLTPHKTVEHLRQKGAK